MKSKIPFLTYTNSCPNCGGDVTADRLFKGSACSYCISQDIEFDSFEDLVTHLAQTNKLNKLKDYFYVVNQRKEVFQLFRDVLDSEPIGPQRAWITRALLGDSFAIVAPPGMGKTTFGTIMALYYAKKGGNSIMIFPTRTIVKQFGDRLRSTIADLKLDVKIAYYTGHASEKENLFNIIKNQEKQSIVLITTTFLRKYLETIQELNYNFLFIDDVDAALKSSKTAKTILNLIGFTDTDINKVKDWLENSKQKGQNEKFFDELLKIRRQVLGNKVVIFSSATISRGNPILSMLMGFRPGTSIQYIRKIIDTYIDISNIYNEDSQIVNLLEKLLAKLGSGGLIFVPIDRGLEYAKFLEQELSSKFKVASISSEKTSVLDDFVNGEIDALIGVATHYGILVRGIDIPWRIKYAIFVGIPKFRFKIGEKMHPVALSRLLTLIAAAKQQYEITKLANNVRRKIRRMSPSMLTMLAQKVKQEGKTGDSILDKGYDVVLDMLKDQEVLKKLKELGDLVIEKDFILLPDYLTYIQASGRTSRIYGGDFTTGLSVLLVDNESLFNLLNRQLSLVLDEINWNQLDIESWNVRNISSLNDIIIKLNEERSEILKLKQEGHLKSSLERVKAILFIVESPNKARTISNFFGKPSTRLLGGIQAFETVIGDKILVVAASGGHVYDIATNVTEDPQKEKGLHGIEVIKRGNDLVFNPYYVTIKRCINPAHSHQFAEEPINGKYCPVDYKYGEKFFEVAVDKSKIIESLRRLALEADEVLIGTDPDTEGEKISWDIYLALRPFNPNIKRAEFHEVTRRAILNAILNPRDFDINLVKAQIVRRIEDRWIGFELTKKLRDDFLFNVICKEKDADKYPSFIRKLCEKSVETVLSAGRVQTPVLGWIIKRYDEFNSSKKKYYVIKILKDNENTINEISILLESPEGIKLKKGTEVEIHLLEDNIVTDTFGPLPPYTTDELLHDASDILGLSASDTMKFAQDLFELGLITYHRTDSTRISTVGRSIAEKYLQQVLGEQYRSIFAPREWGQGGAHEAIRPTRPLDRAQLELSINEGLIELVKPLSRNHFRLYDLIFKRFISSQISPISIKRRNIKYEIAIVKDNKTLKLSEGTLSLVIDKSLNGVNNVNLDNFIYLPMKTISSDTLKDLDEACKMFNNTCYGKIDRYFMKSDVNLYTQGELVQEMKKKNIGRPSTYASIISIILKRKYAMESKKMKKIIPTSLGREVYQYLTSKYMKFVDEKRTELLEEEMEAVQEGKKDYVEVLKELYDEIQSIR